MEKTLEQYKADAYDALVQIELWQKKLQSANSEIQKLNQEIPEKNGKKV